MLLLESKLAIQGAVSYVPPRSALAEFGENVTSVVVTVGGTRAEMSRGVLRIPIQELADFLTEQVA